MLKIERMARIMKLSDSKTQIDLLSNQADAKGLAFIVEDIYSFPYRTNFLKATMALALVNSLKEYVDKKTWAELHSSDCIADIIIACLLKLIKHCNENTIEPVGMSRAIEQISKLYDELSGLKPVEEFPLKTETLFYGPNHSSPIPTNVFSDEEIGMLKKWFGRTNVLAGCEKCVPEVFNNVLIKASKKIRLTVDEYSLLLGGYTQLLMMRLDITSNEDIITAINEYTCLNKRILSERRKWLPVGNRNYLATFILEWSEDDEDELEGRSDMTNKRILYDLTFLMEMLDLSTM